MIDGESYSDIVWRQFKKNRSAHWSLMLLIPLCLLAIGAPVIASNQPFVFTESDAVTGETTTIFPWFRALFNPEEAVDYTFNMALVAFIPWVVVALIYNARSRRRGAPGTRRLGIALAMYIAFSTIAIVAFALPSGGQSDAFLLSPNNMYRARSFSAEEHAAPERTHGIYPLIPFGPAEGDLNSRFEPPLFRLEESQRRESNDGFIHLLGTDDTGRDVLVRMIYGTRISMTVGFVAVALYVSIGVFVGAIAGYFGGKTDILISRIIEIVLLFPSFFLILTLVGLIGQSIYMIMVVIGITGWPTIARLIRGEVLKQRAIEYTAAAQALGASHFRVVFRHIVPNALSPALVAAPFGVASAIITEAGLSLLGFGVRPPAPSWGSLLQLGNNNYHYWWLIVVPSIAIFFTVTVFNLIGSGLRDAMDPKLRS